MKKIIIIMISVVIIWGVSGCMNQNELKDAIDGLSGYVNKSTNDAAEAVTRELELKYYRRKAQTLLFARGLA